MPKPVASQDVSDQITYSKLEFGKSPKGRGTYIEGHREKFRLVVVAKSKKKQD